MSDLTPVFAGFFLVSFVLNIYLALQRIQKQSAYEILKRGYAELEASVAKLKKVPTYDAQQLLHDLTAGDAIVRIQRLGPTDYMVRSPKG